MGLEEATESIIVGVIMLLVISQIIIVIYPLLAVPLSNTTVFPAGGVTLILIGFITLFFAIAILLKLFKQAKQETSNIRNRFSSVFPPSEEE